jgi:hypothetical protein
MNRQRAAAARAGLAPFALALALLAATTPPAESKSSAAPSQCPEERARFDPIALYGDDLLFTVTRNGTEVGEHRVTFRRDGDRLIVDVRFTVRVDVLFIPAYRYTYTSRSTWRDGCMIALEATVDDDGTRTEVSARGDADQLRITGPLGAAAGALGLLPTDHWHSQVLDAREVLNTLTGRINRVEIVDRGDSPVLVDGRLRPARHYAYTGDLTTEVWYDDKGRWMKLRFKAGDGSTIESLCHRCGSDRTASR